MPWQQVLLTFWPGVEFQLLMAGDSFSSVVIHIPLGCSGHMKPGWWETALASLSAAYGLAHHTSLPGELSSFFNTVLPVASLEWQWGSSEMAVQSQRSVRGQPELQARFHAPYEMLVLRLRAFYAENSNSYPHEGNAGLNPCTVTHHLFWLHARTHEGFSTIRKDSLWIGLPKLDCIWKWHESWEQLAEMYTALV